MTRTAEQVAMAIAGGRIAYGVGCMTRPRLMVGPAGKRAEGQMSWMVRAFGVRDVILGAGTLLALTKDPTTAVGWVALSTAADALDVVNAAVFHNELDKTGVAGVLALAVPATIGGIWATAKLNAQA